LDPPAARNSQSATVAAAVHATEHARFSRTVLKRVTGSERTSLPSTRSKA
jgi:hypothetical protein